MFVRRILSWAILGSLVSVVLLWPIKAVPDDSKVSIYNEDMVLVFQGTHSEFVANPLPEVEMASDWKSTCWKTLKTFWAIVTNNRRTSCAKFCLDGLRYGLSYDLKEATARANECYCGISLGPDVDNKGIIDDESPNSLLSAVKARIEHPASDGDFTIEWTIGMKHFAGIIFDRRGDYSGVNSALERWRGGPELLRNEGSVLNSSEWYLGRYKYEL
jgi:hypothetical protein